MDQFGVPKVVNRHVFQALMHLQEIKKSFVTEAEIAEMVKNTMRFNNPRPNIDEDIHISLLNLTELGLVANTESSKYGLRHVMRSVDRFKREVKSTLVSITYGLHSKLK